MQQCTMCLQHIVQAQWKEWEIKRWGKSGWNVNRKKKKIMNKKIWHKKKIFKSQRAKIKMSDLVKEFYFKGS